MLKKRATVNSEKASAAALYYSEILFFLIIDGKFAFCIRVSNQTKLFKRLSGCIFQADAASVCIFYFGFRGLYLSTLSHIRAVERKVDAFRVVFSLGKQHYCFDVSTKSKHIPTKYKFPQFCSILMQKLFFFHAADTFFPCLTGFQCLIFLI